MDVALAEEAAAGSEGDQDTNLGIVNVYHDDAFAFHRNDIEYTITALGNAEPRLLPILQSWQFTN
jgi:hypothetical protein